MVAGLAAVLVAGGVAVIGLTQGNDVRSARLLSGSAWLASAKVGQITLLDGASAEVSAQVKVAGPGDALTVVQQGSTAYTVDQSTGTIRRVDGATFTATPPAAPIADVHGSGLSVVAGPSSLYTLDTTRGLLASTDPKTLDRRGEMLSVAGRLAAGTVTVDDTGTLWAVDTVTGDVNRVAGQDRTIRPGVVKPGNSVITIADGHPVIVNLTDHKAVSLDGDNGRVTGTLDLDLRPDDQIQVSGSRHAERIYVVAARGVLDVCDLAESRCDSAIPLNVGSDFGPAVEAGDRVFVPDYTTGQVWVINLRDSRVIAKPNVLAPKVRFQLMTRDGLVFYNDTNSDQAGVVRLDGGVTTIRKYDRDNPDKGLSQSGDGVQPSGRQSPGAPGSANPQPATGQSGASRSSPSSQSVDTRVPGSNDPRHPSDPQPPQDPGHPNDPQPLNLQIVVDKSTPTVNEPISLTVTEASGVPPRSAHWTYGDRDTNDGVTTNHKWATARSEPYIVSVEVTMPNGQQGTKSVNIIVSEVPKYRLTVTAPSGGSVTGGGIDCPTHACFVDLEKDVQITLTATPDGSHVPGSWGGACHSSDTTCDVRMGTQPVTVSYSFNAKPELVRLTMAVSSYGHGSVAAGGVACPPTCGVDVPKGPPVTLTPHPDPGYVVDWWSGDCKNAGATCSLTMDGPHSATVSFIVEPFKVDIVNTYDGVGSNQGSVDAGDGRVCPPTCHYTLSRNAAGAQLEFKAKVGNSSFKGWTGDCEHVGTYPTCFVSLNKDVSVGARFGPP
ncbi:InlB B-repeat-containing protein [Actinocrispum wychmicini]|nr:hypothetical protein [Actinocrispum wychmicini]